jgi:hypothetical protein
MNLRQLDKLDGVTTSLAILISDHAYYKHFLTNFLTVIKLICRFSWTDIALDILGMYPTMATAAGTESGWRTESYLQALIVLARKPFLIGSESDQLPFWKTLLKNSS